MNEYSNYGKCDFIGEGLRVTANDKYLPCMVYLSARDFTYEAEVKLSSAQSAGVLFGRTGGVHWYYANIGRYGTGYAASISMTTGGTGGDVELKHSVIPSPGTDTFHTIAVIAVGGELTLYVDRQKVLSYQESAFAEGTIGLFTSCGAGGGCQSVFRNVRLWKP